LNNEPAVNRRVRAVLNSQRSAANPGAGEMAVVDVVAKPMTLSVARRRPSGPRIVPEATIRKNANFKAKIQINVKRQARGL
jgi:hypothetical protein